MNIVQQIALVLVGSLELLASTQQSAQAQIVTPGDFFFDDFEDGNLTDGIPGTWFGFDAQGTAEIVAGDLVVTNPSSETTALDIGVAESTSLEGGTDLTDVAVRTQLRFLESQGSFTFAAIFARGTDFGSYWGGILENGEIAIGETLSLDPITSITHQRGVFTGINPLLTDVRMQLEVVGNQLRFTAWAADTTKPDQPQLTFADDTISAGGFGLFTNSSGPSSVAYRYFEAEVVPEPTTALLFCLGAVVSFAMHSRG